MTDQDAIDLRDEAFRKLLYNIGKQEQDVLTAIYDNPNSTDQELQEILDIPLASVNGRRGKLVDKHLVKKSYSKKSEDSKNFRTTWTIDWSNKKTTVKTLTPTEFRNVLKKIRHVGNEFQLQKIIEEANTTRAALTIIDKNKAQPSHPLISYGDLK